MKTPTHALFGYVLAKIFRFSPRQTTLCLLGAIAPDFPLFGVSIYLAAKSLAFKGHFDPHFFKAQMDLLYFEGAWLPVAHNLLHAPLSIFYLTLAATMLCFNRPAHRPIILAFALGAFSHSLLDIVSHIKDGPLILWPIESTMRLQGLFSHWLPGRSGLILTALELLIGLIISVALGLHRLKRTGTLPKTIPPRPQLMIDQTNSSQARDKAWPNPIFTTRQNTRS